jgi:hypothetical protein
MFALPSWGGNRNEAGWKLIGFEDAHVFRPPFGYYDDPTFSQRPKWGTSFSTATVFAT